MSATPSRTWTALAVGGAAALGAGLATGWAAYSMVGPVVGADGQPMSGLGFLGRAAWWGVQGRLQWASMPGAAQFSLLASGLAALASGAAVFRFTRAQAAEAPGVRHLRGRRYIQDPSAARGLFKKSFRRADGLRIHPSFPPIPSRLETFHFFLLAGVGGGKTQVLIPWIEAARSRGDRVLVHDIKGDFTAGLPKTDSSPMVLLAPWDTRSAVWHVAEDVATKAAAREFAAQLIVESKPPMWSNAARAVLTGILIYLQSTKPGRWGFGDAAKLAAADRATLLEICQAHHPEAVRMVEHDNVTTQGILINLAAYFQPVFDLAAAWPNAPAKGRGFSVRRWLLRENRTCVILQGNEQFKQLATGLHASLVAIASQLICSPALPDSQERRIWFMLDEFPRLGKLDVEPLLAVGRSKGIRVVLAAQALDQLKEIHGRERGAGWLSMVGTRIIGRSEGETAKFACEHIIGEREIERTTKSHTVGSGRAPGLFTSGGTVSTSKQIAPEPVMIHTQLAELGVNDQKTGVELIWLTPKYALRMLWPFSQLRTLRSPSVPAPWTTFPQSSRIPEPQVPPALVPAAAAVEQEGPELPPPTEAPAAAEPEEQAIQPACLEGEDLSIYFTPQVQSAPEPQQKSSEAELADKAAGEILEDVASKLADLVLPGAGDLVELLADAEDVISSDGAGPEVVEVAQPAAQRKRRFKKKAQAELEPAQE